MEEFFLYKNNEMAPAPPVDNSPLGIKLLTAGTSGCVADIITFPLDTAKVRLQVNWNT